MRHFDELYATACLHKGGESGVEGNMPSYASIEQLIAKPDRDYLSSVCLRIFRAGLKHSMVDAKWPEFERVFHHFEPRACAHLSDEYIEDCMHNTALIRHMGKLKAIRANAMYVLECSEQYGGFGEYLANWPTDNIVGLWLEMKKKGAHLGGNSAAAFLRMVGKDTFLITSDVLAVLQHDGIVEKLPSSQKDLRLVQNAFNLWQAQCERPLCEISRVISMAVS